MNQRRTHTTRDVGTIRQLYEGGQLVLATEFQRNSVWPKAAKAYLLDTVMSDRPVPYLYFRRAVSAQSGKLAYEVIDGQQRVRALLEFIDDEFALSESKDRSYKGKRFSELTAEQKQRVLTYDLYVEELTGYSDADITDMFVRMNRFVVKLSPQEIRHAKYKGKFKNFVEALGRKPFWAGQRVFSAGQSARMRAIEFSAELVILLVEGPQDKKAAIDLYYGRYEKSVPFRSKVETTLDHYFTWITQTVPNFQTTRWRKPTDLYALIGAIKRIVRRRTLKSLDPAAVAKALNALEHQIGQQNPPKRPAQYKVAASRQTDNLAPRQTRIAILEETILNA
jgi:hypothetical protein